LTSAHALLPAGVTVLERGWLSSNTVVVRGEDRAAVVDTGYCTHAAQTLDLVAAALGSRELGLIVNTHLHSDHCGGNAALQGRYAAAQTWTPPGLAAAVRQWDEVALTYAPTGQHCPRFRLDGTLTVGDTVLLGDHPWEVHAAPGHDPHSVVLFEAESRALISADALWQNGFGVVFQDLAGEHAFEEVSATLDVIERLRPNVVVPGHGSVFTDVEAALARARERLAFYLADPVRHAKHAAKVLLKFKLLEVQRQPLEAFLDWAETTPYFEIVRQRFFPGQHPRGWAKSLLEDLVRSRAAFLVGDEIRNA
jgi:glyoxylase-like metal-dependent hydrolase (beta-lactamase superfamily II)